MPADMAVLGNREDMMQLRTKKLHRHRSLAVALSVGLVWGSLICAPGFAQNYERYKPLDLNDVQDAAPKLPQQESVPVGDQDDRVLVQQLDCVVIVDHKDKVDRDKRIDDYEGVRHDFAASDSIVYGAPIGCVIQRAIGKPMTLRSINQLSGDIIREYRKAKQPIVDVVIPEQRITGGTLHLIVTETRIGAVKVKPGCYFDVASVSKWVACTRPGDRLVEPKIERDLFWMNQNPFRRVSVDFEKGAAPGTTDVIYEVKDIRPIRFYTGVDDSGVSTLNYGRFFAGFQYGNVLGQGGTLGYQYTGDEDFSLLEAHSVNFNQPLNRQYSWQSFGSWAGVRPDVGLGLTQDGESYQTGGSLVQHLVRNRQQQENVSIGYDFKSTNNNLEFDGAQISDSRADLFQLRFGYDNRIRFDADQFQSIRADAFVGPGGGITGDHSAAAFNTIRPGASPDYVYARLRYERADLLRQRWLLNTRMTGQAASERLLFSETLGLGGFDSIRGFDQRAYNADHGFVANVELGPRTWRWGDEQNPRSLRAYGFVDLGNGYVDDALVGEDAYTFAMSSGVGARYFFSDRLIARFDYGVAIEEIENTDRSDRAHFGVTWIPGPRL